MCRSGPATCCCCRRACRTRRSACADSVGLVIERRRRPGELDGLQWYCERCEHLLYQDFFALTDIEKQFPPVFNRFFGSLSLRTCKHCHAVMEPPLPPAQTHGSQ